MTNLFKSQGINKSELSDMLIANNGEANKTFNWRSSDSEDAFKVNVKEGEKLYWLNKKIEYKYNNEGFRAPYDFNNEDKWMNNYVSR